jgi:hypothetical protein
MWEKTFDSGTSWLHMNSYKRRSNANAFYSPGVDRFFAVDSYDPYTAFEVAQLLSGKVPGISVCVLRGDDAWFDNNNCHEYTLIDKSVLSPGNSVLFNRQIPIIRKLMEKNVVHVGAMPADYTDNDNAQAFKDLQEYTKFVIQAWHAAKICELYFNFLPMESYAIEFFKDFLPEDFATPIDNVNGELKTGITKEIKKILYFSHSSAEALDKIADMWRANLTPMSVHWKDLFYKMLELEQPADLKSADLNIDGYSGFLL